MAVRCTTAWSRLLPGPMNVCCGLGFNMWHEQCSGKAGHRLVGFFSVQPAVLSIVRESFPLGHCPIKPPRSLAAALANAVTALPMSRGILLDPPADWTNVFQQITSTGVCQKRLDCQAAWQLRVGILSSSSGTSQNPQIVAAPDKGENITGRIKVFSSNLKTYCDSFYVIWVFEFTTALRLHVHFTYFIHGFWRFCRDPKAPGTVGFAALFWWWSQYVSSPCRFRAVP